jgi:chromosomal replication initiation ATPase DnaA
MLSPKHIVDIVARQYGLTRSQLLGPSRLPPIVQARHIAMTLALEMVRGASLSSVGYWFGRRHHTTVLHAREAMRRKIAVDRRFAKQVEDLRRIISKAG